MEKDQTKNRIDALPEDRRTFLFPRLNDPQERSRLLRYCVRLVSDPEVAEDITQETLTEAWRQADSLHSPEYWRSWVYGIARNMVMRWQDRRAKDQQRLARNGDAALAEVAEATASIDPEDALEQQEIALLLDRAMDRLPSMARQLLVQYHVEDLPQSEIAAQWGLTENTVAVRLHRAKESLRRILQSDLRQEALAFGLISSEGAGRVKTHLWCPSCGNGHLMADRDSQDRQRLLCSACYFVMGPNPIDFPSNCIFAHENFDPGQVMQGVQGFKPALNRVTAYWQRYLFTGRERGQVNCVGCGANLPLRTTRPAHLQPRPYAGFHIHCERCHRIHVLQPLAFAFCLPEVQRFWKKHPRMRFLPARGIEGGTSFVLEAESVTDTDRVGVVFSSSDYRVLDIIGNGIK